MATLEQVLTTVENIETQVCKIEAHMKELNGSVKTNHTDIAVLKDWRQSQAQPAVKGVQDLKVEVAKFSALGGTFGAIVAIVGIVCKVLGLF